jgi:Tfp pilus assembly protein PilN
VSNGIIDAHLVTVGGSIQAKYVNNSIIDAFGDLTVQKEIIDSTIRLGGKCINPTGTIIASRIWAKQGIDAGNIGTTISEPSRLTVGVDAFVNSLLEQIKSKQDQNIQVIGKLKNEITELEKKDQDLHAAISEYAYTQDRSQLELKDVTLKMAEFKKSGDIQAFHEASQAVHVLEAKIRQAEEAINKGFEDQEDIAAEISQKMSQIQIIEKKNERLDSEKQSLNEMASRKEPIPRVKVARKVIPGTRIEGPHSFIVIHDTTSRCEIAELKQQGDNLEFHEMKIL